MNLTEIKNASRIELLDFLEGFGKDVILPYQIKNFVICVARFIGRTLPVMTGMLANHTHTKPFNHLPLTIRIEDKS